MPTETTKAVTANPTRTAQDAAGNLGADANPDADAKLATHAPGARVDRYVILELVGHGGMGVVYKAYDPELDRMVALKCLRVQTSSNPEKHARAQTRLLREAQALAQLSHPNVVAVFDVGLVDEQVFIAMEYVEGQSLDQWLHEAKRSPKEIVEVMLQAGRGLAAAHRAGLIHRDFKPANTLLGTDGRVRVVDFGLARADAASHEFDEIPSDHAIANDSDEHTPDLGTSSERLLATPLTKAGRLLGTPTYMSPEQLRCKELDAATDQFSFCVTLYQALVGKRPFGGADRVQLAANVAAGNVRPVPDDLEVPDWLIQATMRGLSPERADRFPDMDSLLAVLAEDPMAARKQARAARRRLFVGAGLGLGLGLSVAVFALGSSDDSATVCQAESDKVAEVWNPSVQASIERAFSATGNQRAAQSFAGVRTSVSGYLGRWSKMHADTCKATHVRGEQSEAMLDLRMSCLDRHLRQVKALLDVFADADPALVDRAVADSQKLGHLSVCANTDALQTASGLIEAPGSAEQAQHVAALTPRIHAIDALEKTGRLKEAAKVASETLEEADAIGYRPQQAEARYHFASVLERLSQWDEAETHLSQALFMADASGHELYRAKSASLYNVLLGYDRQQFEPARRMERQARAAIERLGDDEAMLSEWHNHATLVSLRAADLDRALEHLGKAIAINTRLYGDTNMRLAADYTNLGFVHLKRAEYDHAVRALSKAHQQWDQLAGPNNIRLAPVFFNLASAHRMKKDNREALRYYGLAMKVRIDNHGRRHRSVAAIHNDRGLLHLDLGEPAQARAELIQALEILESLDDERASIVYRVNLGRTFVADGQLARAEQEFTQASALCKKLACTTPDAASGLFDAARMLRDGGRDDHLAVSLARQALGIYRALPASSEAANDVSAWLAAASRRRASR